MTILLISEIFPPAKGGSGRWLWELYRRFPRGSVHVAAGEGDGAAEFDRTHDVPVERLRLRFPSWGVFGGQGAWHYARALGRLNALARRVALGRPQYSY